MFTPGDRLWGMGDIHFGERILFGKSKERDWIFNNILISLGGEVNGRKIFIYVR